MSKEKHKYKFQETFMSGRWKVTQFDLPNAEKYLWAIENISMADICFIHALEMNRFFEEACQMIANSIYLFQQGFFDAAFYSLRQSIELSLGAPFLLANPDKMKEWRRLEPGFESGQMAKYLREKEPIFKETRENLNGFFENIRSVQKKTNKYVHKQGYKSFYVMQKYSWSDKREDKVYNQIISDFETTLRCAIGAVAVYRLTIDPLPVLLMDDDIMMRTGDLMTQPYSEEFVDKYIGQDAIEAYKQTQVYKDFRSSLEENEKQNEAVFAIIHYQIIDRTQIEDIIKQLHLLSLYDRLAVALITSSSKIPQVYIDGIICYTSDVKAKHSCYTMGTSYYEEFFKTGDKFNVPFKEGAFLSRVKMPSSFSYIESNDPLDKTEIALITKCEEVFHEAFSKSEDEIQKWIAAIK